MASCRCNSIAAHLAPLLNTPEVADSLKSFTILHICHQQVDKEMNQEIYNLP